MAELHLYEFVSAGFYAAPSKEEAFRLYEHDVGEDEGEFDFKREVPDDELVAVHNEDPTEKWDDPREYQEALTRKGVPDPTHVYWFLKVTAREWANELTHGNGYVFGGDC